MSFYPNYEGGEEGRPIYATPDGLSPRTGALASKTVKSVSRDFLSLHFLFYAPFSIPWADTRVDPEKDGTRCGSGRNLDPLRGGLEGGRCMKGSSRTFGTLVRGARMGFPINKTKTQIQTQIKTKKKILIKFGQTSEQWFHNGSSASEWKNQWHLKRPRCRDIIMIQLRSERLSRVRTGASFPNHKTRCLGTCLLVTYHRGGCDAC